MYVKEDFRLPGFTIACFILGLPNGHGTKKTPFVLAHVKGNVESQTHKPQRQDHVVVSKHRNSTVGENMG